MRKIPKISAIIPFHNREAFLARAVDSVLQQEYKDFELILVDDGSSDSSVSLAEEYQATYPHKIVLLKQPHQGVSSARNAGIQRAKGEYITFLDSDDLWITSKLKEQIEFMEANQLKVCQTEEVWIRHGKRVNSMRKHTKRSGRIFFDCLPLCIVSPSAVMIHREVFERVGLFDERFPVVEDYELWLRISLEYPIYRMPKALIHKFGGHPDQLSRSYWGLDRFRLRALRKTWETKGRALSPIHRAALMWWISEKARIIRVGSLHRKKWFRAIGYWFIELWYSIAWQRLAV